MPIGLMDININYLKVSKGLVLLTCPILHWKAFLSVYSTSRFMLTSTWLPRSSRRGSCEVQKSLTSRSCSLRQKASCSREALVPLNVLCSVFCDQGEGATKGA